MYYNVCQECGANLDPGERCDCKKEKKRREQAFESMIKVDDTDQLTFDLEGTYEKTSA